MEFLWLIASFDPFFVKASKPKTQDFFAFIGFIVLLFVVLSFVAYFYVVFLLSENYIFSFLFGVIFSLFNLSFYRLVLLSYNSKNTSKSNQLNVAFSNFIRIIFISLSILFFSISFLLLIYQSFINEEIKNQGLEQGLFVQAQILFVKTKYIYFKLALLVYIFVAPLLVRLFIKTIGDDYDFMKKEAEEYLIRYQFDSFLNTYKQILSEIDVNEDIIIFNKMIDPPFNTNFIPNDQTTNTIDKDVLIEILKNS